MPKDTRGGGQKYARLMIAAGNHPMMVAQQAELDLERATTKASRNVPEAMIAEATKELE